MAEHGTYAHYVTAKCRCPKCREAMSVYMRAWRKRRPERAIVDRRQTAAYAAAMADLRDRHRDEFDALHAARKREMSV